MPALLSTSHSEAFKPAREPFPQLPAAMQPQSLTQDNADAALPAQGNTLTAAQPPSSSPLSFDWSATNSNASVSPSIRAAAAASSRAARAAGPATERQSDGTAAPGTHELFNTNASRTLSTETTDYFAHFPTPPHFNAPPFTDVVAEGEDLTRVLIPATPVIAGAPTNHQGVSNGEPACDLPSPDDVGNFRKRCWPGSPTTEEISRGLSRQRTSAHGPRLWDAMPQQDAALANGSNPWRSSSRRHGMVSLRGSRRMSDFAPVAMSTPLAASVELPCPDRMADHRAPHSLTPVDTNERQHTLMSNQPPRNPPTTHQHRPEPSETTPTMDVDRTADNSSHPRPTTARTSKGKGRATEQECSENAEPGESHIERHEDLEGWSEADLLEARQRSLRQTLGERAGVYSTRGGELAPVQGVAGPSRIRDARWSRTQTLGMSRTPPPRSPRRLGHFVERTPANNKRPLGAPLSRR